MRWVGIGAGMGAVAIGVVAARLAMELRKPAGEQFPGLRRRVNDTVNPWLLDRHIPGSGKAEIGTLEHIGRTSGVSHFTPVHPTLRGDEVYIPAPLGVGSQWARNVLVGGRARLQLHDTLHELVHPELIEVADTGFFPPAVAGPFDRMGWRYVRFHVASSTPGAFTHMPHMAEEGPEPSLTAPFEIPVEPRMVERREPVGSA
jgi:hypothetical protein